MRRITYELGESLGILDTIPSTVSLSVSLIMASNVKINTIHSDVLHYIHKINCGYNESLWCIPWRGLRNAPISRILVSHRDCSFGFWRRSTIQYWKMSSEWSRDSTRPDGPHASGWHGRLHYPNLLNDSTKLVLIYGQFSSLFLGTSFVEFGQFGYRSP